MGVLARLAAIVIGYLLAAAAGMLAVMVNEMAVPADVSQSSGGMVAFGDLVLFLAVAGLVALVPSWYLAKLLLGGRPRRG